MTESLQSIARVVARTYNRPDLFNTAILGRGPYWKRQVEMCNLVVNNRTSVIVSGNSIGKSFFLSGLAPWWLCTRKNSMVVTTAPTHGVLSATLWKYIRQAHAESRIPLGGKVTQGMNVSPQTFKLDDDWCAYGISSTATEKMSGYHNPNLLVIVDEASGVSESVFEALDGLVYSKIVLCGNPLRNYGRFYDLYNKGQREGSGIGTMRIPSTESPDIDKPSSSIGLANMGWLEDMRSKYGENSLWWKTHVNAEFPDSSDEMLIPGEFLDLAAEAKHVRGGPIRIAVDLALGNGNGDDTVICVRDDNGIFELVHSNTWGFEETATRVANLATKYGCAHHRVVFDATGLGADFANRLAGVGIKGARGYVGSKTGKAKGFANLRSAAGWLLRRRLDPNRINERATSSEGVVHQQQFAIPKQIVARIREEFVGVRYFNSAKIRGIELESKEKYAARLGKSPDKFDGVLMSFAYLD